MIMNTNDREYYLYENEKNRLFELYRVGFPVSSFRKKTMFVHTMMSGNYKYNVLINPNGLNLEKVDSHLYITKTTIPPENIICTIDNNGNIENRLLSSDEKPRYIYHGTTIENIESILIYGCIKKSILLTGNYVFGFPENCKSSCLMYGGDNGCIIKIDTSNYNIVRTRFFEKLIEGDVSINDLDSIEFYLNKELICKWDKNTIKLKREYVLSNRYYNILIPVRHLSRPQLDNEQLFDIYNDLILR